VEPTSVGDLLLALDYRWQSDRNVQPPSKLRDQVTQQAFALLNGRVSLTVDAWDADIALFGRNLTDKKYFDSGTGLESLGYNTVEYAEPRTYGIQITKRFGSIR
jgi:iron complex outermembrane receptor protein